MKRTVVHLQTKFLFPPLTKFSPPSINDAQFSMCTNIKICSLTLFVIPSKQILCLNPITHLASSIILI